MVIRRDPDRIRVTESRANAQRGSPCARAECEWAPEGPKVHLAPTHLQQPSHRSTSLFPALLLHTLHSAHSPHSPHLRRPSLCTCGSVLRLPTRSGGVGGSGSRGHWAAGPHPRMTLLTSRHGGG